MFSDVFGGGFRRPQESQSGRGESLYIEVGIKKSDLGTKKTIEFEALDLCKECAGSGIEKGYGMKNCETCHGAGQVRQTTRSVFGYFTRVGVCPKCRGKGKFPEKKCYKCSGDGRVKSKRKMDIFIPENLESDYNVVVPKGGNAAKNGLSAQAGEPGDLVMHLILK